MTLLLYRSLWKGNYRQVLHVVGISVRVLRLSISELMIRPFGEISMTVGILKRQRPLGCPSVHPGTVHQRLSVKLA